MDSESFAPPARPRQHRIRFGSLRAIMALVLREMATTYGRSPGGYLWAIIQPAAGIALMSVVFSAFLRTPDLGINFQMFYATGMLPYQMFNTTQAKVAGGLTYSRPLLAYPTVTYIDSLLARFLLEMMTKLLVSYVVIIGIMLLFETRVSLNFPVIIEAYALVGLLALGIGTLNCYLFTQFSVYERAWSIFTTPLFILSGVFYILETVPESVQKYLSYNPLIHLTGMARMGFYGSYRPDYISVPYVTGIALVSLTLGLLFLRRYHRELLSNR